MLCWRQKRLPISLKTMRFHHKSLRQSESIANIFVLKAFRWFDPYRRRDGSVLEGTICKQFVSNAKKRKNLKPCRGFKSFRSLVFRIQFMKKCVFGSSNPSTRRKIENGSMEIRKKLGAKKAEKSLEISAFLLYHYSLNLSTVSSQIAREAIYSN